MRAKSLLRHPESSRVPGTSQELNTRPLRLKRALGAPQRTDSFSVPHPEQPGQPWEKLKIREGKHGAERGDEGTTPA